MRLRTLGLVGMLLLSTGALFAQQDRAGCKDATLLKRVSGCYITFCAKSDDGDSDFTFSSTTEPRTKNFKGKTEIVSYQCKGKSALQVRSYAEEAFRNARYTIDFTGYDMPEHFVTGHKGAQWLAVVATESGDDSDYRVVGVLTSTP